MDNIPKFTIIDYTILFGTILFSILIGIYYAFIAKQKTNNDLLVGGRNMSVFPVSLSLLATYVSATIILGWTGEIYANGAIIAEIIVVALIFIPLGSILFLPTIFRLRLTSAYEYLELRFKSRLLRLIATITFTAQIILYMGVVLYAPCLGLEAVTGFPVSATVVIVGLSAALYTSIGGYKAVVWTDVFQMVIMFAGLIAIVVQGWKKLNGFENILEIARKHGRLEFLKFDVDPFIRHTSLNIFFGQGAMWLSAYGCHQTTIQRYCSLSSYKKALSAALLTAPLVACAMLLTVISGIVVFANYAGCDPITLGIVAKKDQMLPYFVLENLSATPGLVGLFTACLLSGALSTISSGLNSLAAVLWEDVLKDKPYFQKMSEVNQGLVVKAIGFTYGILTIGMAFIAGQFSGILAAALVIFGGASGPILGTFVLGIFIPFINKYGAILGILIGEAIIFWISVGGLLWAPKPIPLPYSIDECPANTWEQFNRTEVTYRHNLRIPQSQMEQWPDKLYTVSYLLYTLVGALSTIIVGIVVSLLTGRSRLTPEMEPFLHPVFRLLRQKLEISSARNVYRPSSEMVDKTSITSKQSIANSIKANGGSYNGIYKKNSTNSINRTRTKDDSYKTRAYSDSVGNELYFNNNQSTIEYEGTLC